MKNKRMYITLILIHAIAIAIFSAICIMGLLSLWFGVVGEFSYNLMFLVFGLIYIIVKTGGEIDRQLEVK